MKRVVTIQDISCLGKCSLTVALPIISALYIPGFNRRDLSYIQSLETGKVPV